MDERRKEKECSNIPEPWSHKQSSAWPCPPQQLLSPPAQATFVLKLWHNAYSKQIFLKGRKQKKKDETSKTLGTATSAAKFVALAYF